ncbi:NAD(P)/FAD-dependent oxidoreductase [Allopusillimonas soli]|nr:FAD-dependent oxidoreductase [Allopusillimonas soli]
MHKYVVAMTPGYMWEDRLVGIQNESIKADTVIVGAGHAGVECAFALRAAGYEESIILLGEESRIPYQRPPLSKAFLAGQTTFDRIELKAADNYEKQKITFLRGERVTRVDTDTRQLITDLGRRINFRQCVLALGASARELPSLDNPGLHMIRTADDALRLRSKLAAGKHLLVVGGGYLGLEVASTAIGLGARVTVLEQATTLMAGRVSAHTSREFERMHREAGITLIHGSAVRQCAYEESSWRVELDCGQWLEADVLLASVGAAPNTRLAELAGLACNNGIVVDEICRTSSRNVYAIGDCASRYRSILNAHVRVESVQNALEQARIVATVIARKPLPAHRPCTFWSEQHGRRLQVAGLIRPGVPCEENILVTRNGWIVERYQGGTLAVVEAVDSPIEFVKNIKRIGMPADVAAPVTISPEEESQ